MLGDITEIKEIAALIHESSQSYKEFNKVINETLKDDEIAILFIREGHGVQFPDDVEVFSVAPPALDEIHRWLRARASKKEAEGEGQSAT